MQLRKYKTYHEEAKSRQVSHWDFDYMTTQEIQAFMQEIKQQPNDEKKHSYSLKDRILRLLSRKES